MSTSSLSKSFKFLILQFLVEFRKMHSAFKIPSKSHMLDIVLISSVYYKCSLNFDLILPKSLNNLNLLYHVVPWLSKWKKLNLRMLSSFKGFYLSIKSLCGTLIINLGKNWTCVCYCKQIKTSLQESIKSEYKICISNLSMNNYI